MRTLRWKTGRQCGLFHLAHKLSKIILNGVAVRKLEQMLCVEKQKNHPKKLAAQHYSSLCLIPKTS